MTTASPTSGPSESPPRPRARRHRWLRRWAPLALALSLTGLAPVLAAPSASAQSIPANEFLTAGLKMIAGDVILSATSGSGSRDRLDMQADGNLVLYHFDGRGGVWPVWASNTQGKGNYAKLGTDGNFAVYNAGGWILWSARAPGRTDLNITGAVLKVQYDDKLVIYTGNPYWVPKLWSCEWDRRPPGLPFCS